MPRSAAIAARSTMRENRAPSAAHRVPTRTRMAIVHFPLMLAQRPHFSAGQWMCGRRAALDAADVQGRGLEVDLLPAQIADLGSAQPVRKVNRIISPCVTYRLFLAASISRSTSSLVRCSRVRISAFFAARTNCSIYSGWTNQLQARLCHRFTPLCACYCTENRHFLNSCERRLGAG